MRKKFVSVRKKTSWTERGYFFLSLIFVATLCLAGIRTFFFGVVFPIWYWLGLAVMICPFMLNFLDKEALFCQGNRNFVHPVGKRSLGICLLMILVHYSIGLQDIAIWALLIFGLLFGLNGRFCFWLALWMLGFTVFSLVFHQEALAEIFSIYLYYFLCIGVLFELVDGKISHRLGSDFLSHFGNKNLKNYAGEKVQKIEKYMGVCIFAVLILVAIVLQINSEYVENLMEKQAVLLSGLTVLLMVLRGKEYLVDIAKFSFWLGGISSVVFVLLVRFSFYFSELELGIFPLLLGGLALGMMLIHYIFGGKNFLLFSDFICTDDENER